MTKSRFNGKDGTYNPNKGISWADLAVMMQHDMDERKLARRQYTGNMLCEHWYQAVEKDWGEDRVKILATSAKAARRGAGRQPRSFRVKKAKQMVDTMSPLPVAIEQSRKYTVSLAEAAKRSYFRQIPMELSGYTSNHSFMANHAAPESRSTQFEGSSMTQRRYPSLPILSGSSKNGHFHPYRAPDTHHQAHLEHAAIRHPPRHSRRPEAQTPFLTLDSEAHMRYTSTTASRTSRQPLSLQQRQPIIIRGPTPEEDENSLFVAQDYSEYSQRISVPRPNTELNAAVTMTMFRRQGMHTLHRTPSRFDHPAGSHSYQRYIEHTTSGFRLGSTVPRLDTVYWSQK